MGMTNTVIMTSLKESNMKRVLCKVSIIKVLANFTPTYDFFGYTDDVDLIDKLLVITITGSNRDELVNAPVFKVEQVTIDNDAIKTAIRELGKRGIYTNIDDVL